MSHLAPGDGFTPRSIVLSNAGSSKDCRWRGRRRPYRITAPGATALRAHLDAQRRARSWPRPSKARLGHAVRSPEERARRFAFAMVPALVATKCTRKSLLRCWKIRSRSDPTCRADSSTLRFTASRLPDPSRCDARLAPRRRAVVGSGATLVVVVGAIALATGGFGLVATSGPSKGGMPYEPGKSADYSSIPDYVVAWIAPEQGRLHAEGLRRSCEWFER